MKTAEEWHNQYRKDEGWVYPHIDDIRAIQADALRHAAGILNKHKPAMDRNWPKEDVAKHFALDECENKILAEAKQLTATHAHP